MGHFKFCEHIRDFLSENCASRKWFIIVGFRAPLQLLFGLDYIHQEFQVKWRYWTL